MSSEREKEGLQSLGKRRSIARIMLLRCWKLLKTSIPTMIIGYVSTVRNSRVCVPLRGNPDFAEIRISYIPDRRMVESKSLKLYLFSFRNHGDFLKIA